MIKNNYTRPESGPAIELVCAYDTDQSRWLFEENFQLLQHNGYSTTSVLYYIDNGNAPNSDDIRFTVKGLKKVKVDYLAKELNYTKKEIRSWDIETIDQEIISYFEDVNLINYALDRMPDAPEGLEFVPTKNLISVSSRGYSQGDYSTILYCPDDLEKAWGRAPDQSKLRKMFDHYLWDAPIYARFEIDGEEYYYFDQPEYDEYEWDREAFAKFVSEKSGVDYETLLEFLPENPSYD